MPSCRGAPSEPFASLPRRDELVLIEPGADVVALHRPLETNVTRVARRIETGAHDVETARPAFIGKMKDLAADNAFVCLDNKAVCFGQIGDMDPGPASFTIAAEDRVALVLPWQTSPR